MINIHPWSHDQMSPDFPRDWFSSVSPVSSVSSASHVSSVIGTIPTPTPANRKSFLTFVWIEFIWGPKAPLSWDRSEGRGAGSAVQPSICNAFVWDKSDTMVGLIGDADVDESCSWPSSQAAARLNLCLHVASLLYLKVCAEPAPHLPPPNNLLHFTCCSVQW